MQGRNRSRAIGIAPACAQNTAAGHKSPLKLGSHLAGYVVCGLAIAIAGEAVAQGTLPPVTVEGSAVRPKQKARAKASPKAAPVQTQVAPPEPVVAAPRTVPPQDVPYETPAAVSTATQSDLQTFGQVNTGDVLRAMPGTYTRESATNPGIAVNIRGMEGSGRVNMMIDGVRQNFRFTTHEASGMLYVDPALLAGIDIQRGPISTTGGAGALAGSANFRTLGIDDIIKPGNSMGAITSLTWGSNNQGFSEMGAAAVRSGSVAIGGAISHRSPDDYKNGDGLTIPYSRQDVISGLVKAEFGATPFNRLTLGGVFYDNDFFAQSVYQQVDSKVFTAKYRYTSMDNPLIDFRFNASMSDVAMHYRRNIPGLGGSTAGRHIRDEGIGFDMSNTSRFNWGAVRVKSEYGVEYFNDDVTAKNLINPPAAGGVNPSGEATTGGVFSQTTFSYGMFDLITGLRYDFYQIDGKLNTTDVDISGERLNPKVTLAAQVTPWLQPYITYAEAFRAPTIQETMLGGNHPGGGPGFTPNPLLKPEIQKGWELGANVVSNGLFTHRDAFRFKVAYFKNDVEDYITGCFPGFGPCTASMYINNPGTSKLQGVELQGSYDAGFLFGQISYTYTDSDLPTQINGLGAQSFTPEHVLVMTAGLRFLNEKLTIGARGTITSEAFTGDPNAMIYGTPLYTDGYALLDLFSNYKINDTFEIGASVNNVFDEGYTKALTTAPSVSCAPAGVTCNTGMGRTFLLTAKTHF